MAFARPRADVRPSALPLPYDHRDHRVEPRNTLAALAPVTWLSPRPAPQSELRAVLRSPAAAGLLASDAAVLGALWLHRNASGTAWPCVETLAELAHVSRRTTFSALARLERAGLIVRRAPSLVARRRRQSTTYTIPAAPPTLDPHAARAPRAAAPVAPVAPVAVPAPAPRAAAPVAPVAHVEPSKPAQSGATDAPDQVKRLHPKDHSEEPDRTDARADAQARAATAPPGDRLGPPAVAQSVPEVTPTKITSAEPSSPEALPSPRRTRAERAAANRAAWAARTRTSASATRATTPRRAPSYRARDEQAPDPRDALAALREWRESLPARGALEPASAPQAPAHSLPRSDRGPWRPRALGELLGAFAPVPVGQHVGLHARPVAARDRLAEQTRSDHRGARAPGHPRVEERAPPLRCPHSSG